MPPSLTRDIDGVWHAGSERLISYPKEASAFISEFEASSFWFRHRNQCILATMRRFPPNGAVVDIGGGNGFVAAGIQNAGMDVLLVEPGQTAAATARQRGVRNVVCATLEDAGFADDSLPSAAAFDVLEHLADDRANLALIHKLLRPRGRLYISVPAYQFLFSGEDHFAGHFRRYTLASLSKALRGAGFQVEYASYIFAFLPLPIFLFRTIPSRLKRVTEGACSERFQADAVGPRRFRSAINLVLRAEVAVLERGRRIPFGGSCLVVAVKETARVKKPRWG
jgi:SAM-dependent methyltransferase